jgi:nitric oxide dioxygenase
VRYDAPRAEDIDAGNCDSAGLMEMSLLRKLLPSNDAHFYFCGPKPFMSVLYHGLKDWGVSESQIHFEFFGPKQDILRHAPPAHSPLVRNRQPVLA